MKRFSKIGCILIGFILFSVYLSGSCLAAEFNLKDFTNRYEKAVVFITTYDDKGRQLASGSGFFISPEGNFVTNRHVLEGAVSATIETSDGEKFTLDRLLTLKPGVDLVVASIKNPPRAMPYLEVAEETPEKGDRVIVFGNPLKVKFSVSEGIVSGIQTFPNPEWPQLTDLKGTYIQFTAAISSGSSGGPVLNEAGKVIGVTTWGFVPRVSQNLNFAIPAEIIRSVIASQADAGRTAAEQSEPSISEKKRVAILVMYGPTLLEQIKNKEKRDQLTALVEEAITNEFRANKYIVKQTKDTLPTFETRWKLDNGLKEAPTMDDVDKESLVRFGESLQYDIVVFAGVEFAQAKRVSNIAYAASAIEVEVDMRVTNIERKEYSYSKILVGQGSYAFQKFWGWESPNMLKPASEALTYALRYFKREFSADQIL
ncbi:MAG TPA: S1C family serine protease [Selenomonadales bacterium]|nr:S1C family serine protease [Selenomonadales bacterium]